MKVRLIRSGGVAGVRVVTELESGELTPEESERLARLVEDAAWAGLPAGTMRRPEARDLMDYAVTVEGEGAQRSLEGDDLTLAPAARELVAFVIERGRHLEGARR